MSRDLISRRAFVRRGAIYVPALIGLSRKAGAQFLRNAAFTGIANAPAAGGGGTDVDKDTNNGTTTGSEKCGDVAGSKWLATSWVAGSGYTDHQMVLRLAKVGSPTGNITAYIYSDSSNVPGSALSSGTSGVLAASTFGTAEGDQTFTNLGASIVNGTKYWDVIQNSAAADASNYILWYYDTLSSDANGRWKKSSNGTSWANISNTHSGKFTMRGQ